jgi:aryl-alcohol dehydrogenase-like predicted oxidoreductase
MADGIVPIIGVTTPDQLDQAIQAARLTLDDDTLARLHAPS